MSFFTKDASQETVKQEAINQKPKELTYEEKVNKSWEYLNVTANKVANLPSDVQEHIVKLGRVLNEFKMVYIHVIDEGAQVKQSPAKVAAAALEAYEAKQTGGAGSQL